MTKIFAKQHNIVMQQDPDKSWFKLGNGRCVQSLGRAYVYFRVQGHSDLEERRWFHVLEKCAVPLILGMGFINKTKLYTENRHLLVDCPNPLGKYPRLKLIGNPRASIQFTANNEKLIGFVDTGSDLDFMSLECTRRLGLVIDTSLAARTRVMLADETIVETVGQVHITSVEISSFNAFDMNFHVLPDLISDVLFGEDFIEQMDAFNTCAQINDLNDIDQQYLNTLISLGRMQALLSKIWKWIRVGLEKAETSQTEHDNAVDIERHRRNQVQRQILKIRDENQAAAAWLAEILIRKAFDLKHQRCALCVREGPGTRT